DVRLERRDLAAEDDPAQALVGRVPRMREDRHLARVDDGACIGEEVCRRPLRAEYVRLETRVEMADELGERRRGAAELRTMMDVEDRDPLRRRQDALIDRLDSPGVASRIEVLLRVRAGGAAERASPVGVLEQVGDCFR